MNYRDEVKRTLPDVEDLMLLGTMGLVGESGEVADLVKKHMFQGAELNRERMIKELGDVRWYMEVLCMALNTTLTEVEQMNIDKLRARYPNGFSVQDSSIRKEGDV